MTAVSLFRAAFTCLFALGAAFCPRTVFADTPAAPRAALASGWVLERVGTVDQSYAGWDVEIGDADNDGKNEILTTGCPDSRLHLFKKTAAGWQARQLADNLAEQRPGMGLAVRVADLNGDGRNEVLLGTGQEGAARPSFTCWRRTARRSRGGFPAARRRSTGAVSRTTSPCTISTATACWRPCRPTAVTAR